MKKLCKLLLMIWAATLVAACEKADYEVKAEKSAQERAERNRADHERRTQ
ncbi:hypothetical protein V8J88_23610 [Massilia sp. W12]